MSAWVARVTAAPGLAPAVPSWAWGGWHCRWRSARARTRAGAASVVDCHGHRVRPRRRGAVGVRTWLAVDDTALRAAAGTMSGVEVATLKVLSDDLQTDFSLLYGPRASDVDHARTGRLDVVIQNLALRAGSLSSAQASMTIATPIVSAVIGWIVFGEHIDVAPATVTITLGCAVLAVAGVLLSGSDARPARGGRWSTARQQRRRPPVPAPAPRPPIPRRCLCDRCGRYAVGEVRWRRTLPGGDRLGWNVPWWP